MALAEQFRRSFAAGLRSGQYEPWKSKINELIHKVKTLDEFMGCLNALCDEFDPAKPPRRLGAKPSDPPKYSAEAFNLDVALLELLLDHGIKVASLDNTIATIIAEFTDIAMGQKKPPTPNSRLLVYASRFNFIAEISRNRIWRAARSTRDALEKEYINARFLIDDLVKEFRKRNGRTHHNFDELYEFDAGDEARRTKFHKMAEACEKARRAALGQKDFKKSAEKLTNAFEAFQKYVRTEVQHPVDLFRLLKWAREPGEYKPVAMKGGGTLKADTAASKSAKAFFLAVKEELYLEIACYGLNMAITNWKFDTVIKAVGRLRMAPGDASWQVAWRTGATGFGGDDARYIYAPFPGPEPANLFRARLLGAQRDPKKFFALQNQRRCMEVLAELRGMKLVDELKLAAISSTIKTLMKNDPVAVSALSFELIGRRHNYGTWHIGDGYPRSFSIFWIGLQPGGRKDIYVELDRYPGFVFVGPPDHTMGDLVEAAQYVDIGESWEALKALAIAYLMVLGFALDVVSAGIAGNTLRGAILHFLAERVAEKVVQEGLDLAGLDHPLLQFVAGALVNAKLTKTRKLFSLEEIEEAERSVMRGVTRPVKGAARESAKEALDNGLSKKAKGLPDKAGRPVGENLDQHSNHVFSYEASPNAYRDLPQAKKDRLIKDQLGEFADEEESLVKRLTEPMNRFLAAEEVPAMTPALAAAGAGGGGTTGGPLARIIGALKPGGPKAAKGAGKGSSYAPSPSQNKFSKSRLFNRLKEYDEFLTDDMKNALRKERTAILHDLGPPASISLKDARKRMMHVINQAKEAYGELNGEMVARSNFNVASAVTIPVRGDEGAPMLDWVGRLAKGSKLKFVLVEAKGGPKTRLGRISRKVYHFVGGRLAIKSASSDKVVKQASGEWYYQKCAEIFISGQKATDAAEGAARKKLALELFQAAEEGKVGSIITKFGMDDENIIVNTDEVVCWFAKRKKSWDWTHGFPI